jgi:hypothetical protein
MKNGKPFGEEKMACFSAFVLEVFGKWCLVTAGHVIQDKFLAPVEKGLIRLNKFLLADYFGPDPVVKEAIPFDYEGAGKCFLDDSSLGLDFALIALRPFYRDSLQANGVIPISRSNWANAVGLTFPLHLMVGMPEELSDSLSREGERGGQVGQAVAPLCVVVRRLDKVPKGMNTPEAEWFIGRVNVDFSVVGMSGGPIFGVRQNEQGQWTYHTVAVQSWWDRERKVIFGCPIPRFMGLVEEGLLEYAEGQMAG